MLRKSRSIILTIAICVISTTTAFASGLVTRDDFVLYDTNVYKSGHIGWSNASIDGSGQISQTNEIDTALAGERRFVYQFNRFAPSGNQILPPIEYLPYVWDDTTWWPNSWNKCYSNESGATFIISQHSAISPSPTFVNSGYFIHRFTSAGVPLDTHTCLSCDLPDQGELAKFHPRGAINGSGVVGAVWGNYRMVWPYDNVLYLRLYYPDSNVMSPAISMLELGNPLDGEPGYRGDYRMHDYPAMGIADDGGYAVAWVPSYGYDHIYYAVFNPDHSIRSPVQIVNCDGGYFDTAQCTVWGFNTRIDMAMESDGDFYIVWQMLVDKPVTQASRHRIYMRGYNSDGTPKYGALRVDDKDSLWDRDAGGPDPKISCNDSGNVLVAWSDQRHHGLYQVHYKRRDLFVQKVDPSGELIGLNYRINNKFGAAWHYNVACDMNNAGQVLLHWREANVAGIEYHLKAQLMPYDDIGVFEPGDINYDMAGDISDLTALIDYMFGGALPSFWPLSLTDFNSSGDTDISDLTYYVSWMFAGGPAPIVPDPGIRPPTPLPY